MATNQKNPVPELGVTGLRQWSGYINEEFLADLKGTAGVKVYREMSLNDPVVGACLFAVETLLRQVEWTVEAASDKPDDQDNAEFLKTCLEDMEQPWSAFIAEVLSFLVFGWSYHEIVYKKRAGKNKNLLLSSKHDDGMLGWARLPVRAQESLVKWEFDAAGEFRGMWQSTPPMYKQTMIPREKAVHFRLFRHKDNPEGRSILRTAYRPWYFKKRIEDIEAIGVERDLAGFPVVRIPGRLLAPTATADEKSARSQYERLATEIRRDAREGIVLSSDRDVSGNFMFDVQLLSTGSRRQFDTNAIVTRYDQRIAMTILADFILLGHEKVGSFALSSDKTDLFAVALGAVLGVIRDTCNSQLVSDLFAVNGKELEALPKLEHGDIEKRALLEVAEAMSKLAGTGMELFPDPVLDAHVRNLAGLPPRDEETLRRIGEDTDETDPGSDEGAGGDQGGSLSPTNEETNSDEQSGGGSADSESGSGG